MLSCRKVSELLSDALDRRPRPAERLTLRLHLLFCKACSRVENQLKFLGTALSRSAERPTDRRK
jgi:putative zinc finger protein